MTLAYPTNSEYVTALKNQPAKRFTSPLLQKLKFERKGMSLDLMVGGFALVFKAIDPTTSERYAVRCFKGHSEDREKRYSEIRDFLKAKKNVLPYFVKFDYYHEEIRIKSAEGLPVVLMKWSKGALLKHWLAERCQANDGARVLALAERWRKLITDLRAHNVAHGDLQHGNVMVSDQDQFILIDYDGMAVPNLQGPDSPEAGLPGYQHRDRITGKWNKLCVDLDNFSAINIYVCLRAIAANPEVFERFSTDNDEGLLFDPSDMEQPDTSTRFNELKSGADPQVEGWVEKFHKLATGPLSAVPALDQFLCDPAKIDAALDEADWDEAVRLAKEFAAGMLPVSTNSRLDSARASVEARRRLKEAIVSGDERKIEKVWDARIFANYPQAQSEAAYAKLAVKVAPVIDKLSTALRKSEGRQVVRIWDDNQSLLVDRKSATRHEKDVQKWRTRNDLADKVQSLIGTADTQLCPELVNAAEALQQLGGHPDTNKLPKLADIVRSTSLAVELGMLSNDETAKVDAQWTEQWDATLLVGFDPAVKLRQHYLEVQDRKARYDRIHKTLESDSTSNLKTERVLLKIAKSLPDGYCPLLTKRATTARKLIKAVSAIQDAIGRDCNERTLVKHLKTIRGGSADKLLPATDMARLLLAELRVPVLETLEKLDATLTPDADQQFISAWDTDELSLAVCSEAQTFQGRVDDARERKKLLAGLQTALRNKDDLRACKLAMDPRFHGFELDQSTQKRIQRAKKDSQVAEKMLQRIRSGDEVEFAQTMDFELLSRYWNSFEEHHEQIRTWMANGALKPEFIGLATPQMAATVKRNGPTVKVKWQFPTRVTDTCLVTFSKGRVDKAADLSTRRVAFQHPVTMAAFELGGSACTLPVANYEGSNICVWAVVKVQGERFYSAPLQLGRIPAR